MSSKIQANADDIINNLSQQIAKLTKEYAILNSLVSQYQEKENKETENAE